MTTIYWQDYSGEAEANGLYTGVLDGLVEQVTEWGGGVASSVIKVEDNRMIAVLTVVKIGARLPEADADTDVDWLATIAHQQDDEGETDTFVYFGQVVGS